MASVWRGVTMAIVMRDQVDGKICCKCKEWKPVAEFHRRSASRDGYQSTCRICSNAAVSNYFKRNPEKRREKNRAYFEANREKCVSISAPIGKPGVRKSVNMIVYTDSLMPSMRSNGRVRGKKRIPTKYANSSDHIAKSIVNKYERSSANG